MISLIINSLSGADCCETLLTQQYTLNLSSNELQLYRSSISGPLAIQVSLQATIQIEAIKHDFMVLLRSKINFTLHLSHCHCKPDAMIITYISLPKHISQSISHLKNNPTPHASHSKSV